MNEYWLQYKGSVVGKLKNYIRQVFFHNLLSLNKLASWFEADMHVPFVDLKIECVLS